MNLHSLEKESNVMKYKELLSQMTLEEKASFCSGKDFWHLASLERLNIPEIMVTDGPHGLRKQNPDKDKKEGELGGSFPATCFPTSATTSCSWDTELLREMGEALGEECLREKVSVLLGPGTNIKRSPLCGRNFEYFSEDPYLAGELAASYINGVQSKGVGTSLKHFAGNNQESRRMTVDSVIDERALREIYLAGFETAVKKGKPWTVMNAYNKLNGTYCAENKWLLTDVLRKEWGYDGLVVTDWGAENDRVAGLLAGQELEMPSSGGIGTKAIVNAVKSGALSENTVDEMVDSVLDLIFRSAASRKDYTCDMDAHHELARKIAGQSMVLLKNDKNVLPLEKGKTVAVLGEMARSPRYQGAGSSLINPTKMECAFDALIQKGTRVVYSAGYDKTTDIPDEGLIADAVKEAKKADISLVFIGLTEVYESEGFDRDHMQLPPAHNALVDAVCDVCDNVVVVLMGGAAVAMPWLERVNGVLHAFLGGQAGGAAIADVLTGEVNPSGKLSESYPYALEDNASFNCFPGNPLSVEYRESIFVGYRYYDKMKKEVCFPFGYGLSYTTFKYSALKLSAKSIKDTDELTVSFKVKNTGKLDGAEIAQLYVAAPESAIYKAPKELKGFRKVFLKAGEEKEVSITLNKRSFAYYNIDIHDWHVESGEYEILVGASSRDIILNSKIKVESTVDAPVPDYRESTPVYYTGDAKEVSEKEFETVLGRELPPAFFDANAPITVNNTLEDAANTSRGKKVNSLIEKIIHMIGGGGVNEAMMKKSATQIPIRCFVTMSFGVFTEDMAQGLVDILNGKSMAKGLGKILGGLGSAIKNIGALMKAI